MKRQDGATREGRRLLVATAVAHYPKNPTWDRPGLIRARNQIIELFTGALGYTHISDLGVDPTANQLTEHLRALCKHRVRPNDYLVVYLAGHGEILDNGGHVLLTSDTDPADIDDALPTVTLATKMLRGTPVQRLLLILDTCYSGQGGNEFAAAVLAGMQRDWTLTDRSGLAVITSAQPFEQADTGAFPALLATAVHGYPTAGQVPATLALGAVVQAMNTHPTRPEHQQIGWVSLGLSGEPPDFLPNPRHRTRITDIDLHMQQVAEWETHAERREIEFRRRFLVRAMGGHGPEPTWWFTGRHTALTDITTWLSTSATSMPALIVTGGPGSGKTAVLGLVAALTHPEHRRTVPLDALALPPAATPPLGSVDVTIYAGGLTHEQVLAGLAAAAQVSADTIGHLVAAIKARPRATDRPFTAIIDAIDEAADPRSLVTKVLSPIIDNGHAIRLMLGTRPHLLSLLSTTRLGTTATTLEIVDLDKSRYADHAALTAYTIRGLLEANIHSPYRETPLSHVRAVADAVAAASTPSFLVARIASSTLAAADTVTDPTDPQWRATLPRLPGDAMRNDLNTRLGQNAQRARDLLRPLAYAEGQGLPWENIWAPLASKISGRVYTDADLFWLREHAGSYVVEAEEAGRSAYRLYHQALAEYLRTDAEATGIETDSIQHAFMQVLTRIPRAMDATMDWSRAHPYAVRYLATHAGAARTLDTLLADASFLVHADSDTLLPVLHQATSPEAQLPATVYKASANRHRQASSAERRQLLAVDAARCGADHLLDAMNTGLAWRPQWATAGMISSNLRATLVGHTQFIWVVACTGAFAVIGDGTPGFGEVRVWDLRTGQHYVLTRQSNPVRSVACAEIDGVPVAITEGHIWDLRNGQQLAQVACNPGSNACIDVDGVPTAVTQGGDYRVQMWDLRTGTKRATLPGKAKSVACVEFEHAPTAVTANNGNEIRLWDLRARLRRATLRVSASSVKVLACVQVDGVPMALTIDVSQFGHDGGKVHVLDLRTGKHFVTLSGHAQSITDAACIQVDGVPLAVTVTGDFNSSRIEGAIGGEVRLWDLRTGKLRATFPGHTQPVMAVACANVDGAPIAVTVGGNPENSASPGEVRLWDLRVRPRSTRYSGHTHPLHSITFTATDKSPAVVTGDGSGEVRVWNANTGRHRVIRRGHATAVNQFVNAASCTILNGKPTAITVIGGQHAEIWDLHTGQQRGDLPHPGLILAVDCAVLGGLPVAVTSGDGGVRVWNLQTNEARLIHPESAAALECTLIDGAPVVFAGGRDGAARVLDLNTGKQRLVLDARATLIRAVACGEVDGEPIGITCDPHFDLQVWDLRTGRERAILPWRAEAVACAQLGDTPIAATGGRGRGGSGQVRLWDVRTGEARETFPMPYPVGAIAFDLESRLAVGTSAELVIGELTQVARLRP
jgi:WD40 repeat protein